VGGPPGAARPPGGENVGRRARRDPPPARHTRKEDGRPVMTPWTTTVGWTLVHFLWEGTLIALVAAAALRLLRDASAQARYLTACAALILALLAPLTTAPTLAVMSTLGVGPAPVATDAHTASSTLAERGAR